MILQLLSTVAARCQPLTHVLPSNVVLSVMDVLESCHTDGCPLCHTDGLMLAMMEFLVSCYRQ